MIGKVEGQCPVCKSDNLDYDESSTYDESVVHQVTCEDCGAEGTQTDKIVFDEIDMTPKEN